MSSRIYDFTLAAAVGSAQRFDVQGSQCKVIASPAGPVRIKTDTGEIFDCLEGQGFALPQGQTFRELYLSNLQAIANVGSVFIGDDLFVDSRVTGSIKVVDASAEKTNLQRQYLGGLITGAQASLVSWVGLYANAATVAVRRISILSPAAGLFNVYASTAIGTANPTQSLVANKRLGASSSTAAVTGGTGGSAVPTAGEIPGAVLMFQAYLQANVPYDVPITTPLVLTGTRSLQINGNAQNRELGVVWDFEEV